MNTDSFIIQLFRAGLCAAGCVDDEGEKEEKDAERTDQ